MSLRPNIKTEEGLVKWLEEILPSMPGVEVLDFVKDPADSDATIDAYADIQIQGKKTARLLIQVKNSGYPRDIERISLELKELRTAKKGEEIIPLLGTRSLSPGSRKILRERGVGYFDLGGSLYLPLSDNLYFIDRSPPKEARSVQSVYEGRASQVLHVLLAEPSREWHVNEVAEMAEVSAYTVHQVFTRLENQLLLKKYGKGPDSVRVLENPGDLLDAFEENYSFKQFSFRNYYKWSQSLPELRDQIAKKLEDQKIEYALTLSSGVEMIAPFVTGIDRLHFVVAESKGIDDVIKGMGFQPTDDGANITLMTTRASAPFLNRQRVNGICVASNVQLYLDLSKWRARGKEQAENLRQQKFGF